MTNLSDYWRALQNQKRGIAKLLQKTPDELSIPDHTGRLPLERAYKVEAELEEMLREELKNDPN